MPTMLEKSWVTASEAANIIGCTASRVRAMCAEAILKAEKVGPRVWLIDRKSAEKIAKQPTKTGRPRINPKNN
jgi:hypothetical protein